MAFGMTEERDEWIKEQLIETNLYTETELKTVRKFYTEALLLAVGFIYMFSQNRQKTISYPTAKWEKRSPMSEHIMQLSTFEINQGELEAFKSSIEKSVSFAEENGPQLMVEVYIDEENMRAHSCQIQPDSESMLTHWELSESYIDDVMQHCTAKNVDIYGQPSDEVIEGLEELAAEVPMTLTPHFTGFSRFRR